MSDFVKLSVPAADPGLAVSADCSEVITSNHPEAGIAVTEEMNSLYIPHTLGLSNPTSLRTNTTSLTVSSHDANAACSSSFNDNTVLDGNITVAGSTAKRMCDELDPCAEPIVESVCPSQADDEVTAAVSKVTSAAELVNEQSTEEQCRSDMVTFNLPLEVIGACWFMKRDTETCLQAVTSNDGWY